MSDYHKPAEYKAIKLWGQRLTSSDWFIKKEQSRAANDRAPIDSIYFSADLQRWMYIRDLQPDHSVRVAYEKAQVVA